jgi:hypothetical protein
MGSFALAYLESVGDFTATMGSYMALICLDVERCYPK